MIRLGDLLVHGEPPAKLLKALAVIADRLHPEFDKVVIPGRSKESCVLCSLTVRDFLWKIGFRDAKAVPCRFIIRAFRPDGSEVHSLGIGGTGKVEPNRWDGHMAVTVGETLIDPALYQAKRPAWPDLPGMFAVPTGKTWSHGDLLAGGTGLQPDGTTLEVAWGLRDDDRWRSAPDAVERHYRQPVVKALV